MDLPWWALSPSPFSIAFYLILIAYTIPKLKGKLLTRFAESFFLVGYAIVFLDLFWVIACGLRFGFAYPNSVLQLVFAGLRNIAALAFIWIFVGHHIGTTAQPKETTFLIFLTDLVFLSIWFLLAQSPAQTDWTYALRHGFPVATVVQSFLTSHIIGKTLAGLFYLSWWKENLTFRAFRVGETLQKLKYFP